MIIKNETLFIADAPSPSWEVVDFVEKEKLNVEFITLTHGHFDHIGSLSEMPYPFYVHKEDVQLIKNPDLNGSTFFSSSVKVEREPVSLLEENKPLVFGTSKIEIFHTPGHTPGSVCLKIEKWLFLATHDSSVQSKDRCRLVLLIFDKIPAGKKYISQRYGNLSGTRRIKHCGRNTSNPLK